MLLRTTAALCFLMISGCALFTAFPPDRSVSDRLAALPLSGAPLENPVTIRWSAEQIPYIEAQSDRDLAVALGIVHAHLRLGQMEMLRRVSQGRAAEMFGPPAVKIDHLVRLLDFGRAVPAIQSSLSAETQTWLEGFTAGINFYIANTDQIPHEMKLLAIQREPWGVADIITMTRAMSADVNWFIWFGIMTLRDDPAFPEIWRRVIENGARSRPSFTSGSAAESVLGAAAKSGSNAFVVSAARSQSESALLASDPHLGFFLPNLWLAATYKSPSYHTSGLMLPGVPFVGIGRNERIAWGGTNMWAISSLLHVVPSEEQFEVEEQVVKVRWWFDKKISLRRTTAGPIITDAPYFKDYQGPPLALSWAGHHPSDEIGAFLAANRAQNWDEFKEAFRSYAVSGQTMLYADSVGNIGQMLAVRSPQRPLDMERDFVQDSTAFDWSSATPSPELPSIFNPVDGVLVSTNNIPTTEGEPVGRHYNSNDRQERALSILAATDKATAETLADMQHDLLSIEAKKIVQQILAIADGESFRQELSPAEQTLLHTLKDWDGTYSISSRGAVAYNQIIYRLSMQLYSRLYGKQAADYLIRSQFAPAFLAEDLETNRDEKLHEALKAALSAAAKDFSHAGSWGEMHRLKLNHILGRIPIIGRRYRFLDWAVPGSNTTLWKTAHPMGSETHATRYGAVARYLTELNNPDKSKVVLLGGQDGFLGSENFLDQAQLWRDGRYLSLAFSQDAALSYSFTVTIMPGTDR